MAEGLKIKDIAPSITTFTTPFNRFAPLGRSLPTFVAVGNRATAIRMHDGRILLLNPIKLEPSIQRKLEDLGGVNFLACDLGHHMYVADYLKVWPNAKSIGVPGLKGKRKDVRWDFIYSDKRDKVENVLGFAEDIETVLFEGFITYCVAWYHKPTKTLIQSDLLMNLPCTEQYRSSSALKGPGSWAFAQVAHARSNWFRRLIWYIATVDYALMRRDVKKVAEWDIEKIIPCHGDIIEHGGRGAWAEANKWFLTDSPRPGFVRSLMDRIMFMRLIRWIFLM
ncbi:putative ribonuclease Z/Hydroxyacylglutathione hydrolase [Septoria linicola]|nr:putative ribonuclease Z/Hydroxyacylglutathione hydrolase [Septoria linicola]